jgi:transcriptional regulator with XRE-family HTH domain
MVRRALGRRLKALRLAVGKTTEDVDETEIVSRSKLHRIESGRSVVKRGDVMALAHLYGVDLSKIDDLLALADATKATGFHEDYGSAVAEQVSLFADLEAGAVAISEYNSELVPGLLQTDAYARAVLERAVFASERPVAPETVAQRLAFRKRRQRAFLDQPGRRVDMVLTAGALGLAVRSDSVMKEQRQHLRELTARDGVSVRVLPSNDGIHPAMRGPYVLLDFASDDDGPVVYLESLIGGRYIERLDHVELFRKAFAEMSAQAVPVTEFE